MRERAEYADLLVRYKRRRAAALALNHAILDECCTKKMVETAGKRLGMWQRGTFIFDTEDEAALLMDCALYDCFRNGANAIDRYAAKHPPAAGSDEEALLGAMKQAFYSVFQVEKTIKGVGVRVHDLLFDKERFVVDISLSQTACEGLVLASRLMLFEEFVTTTGAPLLVDVVTLAGLAAYLDDTDTTVEDLREMSRQERGTLAAAIIRSCLEAGASEQTAYLDPDSDEQAADATEPFRRADRRIGRNEPCPCGSGRKYKKCCGPQDARGAELPLRAQADGFAGSLQDLERVEYRRGMLEEGAEPSDFRVTVWRAEELPAEAMKSLEEEGILELGGVYGDADVGDPVQYDQLRLAFPDGVFELEVFNRGIMLLMTDDEKIKRIHRTLCVLDRASPPAN